MNENVAPHQDMAPNVGNDMAQNRAPDCATSQSFHGSHSGRPAAPPPIEFFVKDWERRALQRLQDNYIQLLHRHRVNMPRALIELFDSTTYWGQWLPELQTIRISRNLLTTQPWFHVLGVLQHEMAHQYVDLVLTQDAKFAAARGSGPHGELFQIACRHLGVPAQYARASNNLQTDALDWRHEIHDEASERMLEKVRKLLALANSTNEHEALLAMNRVREIYAKYNLETSEKAEFFHLELSLNCKRVDACTRRILSILTNHFFVQVIMGDTFDVKSGTALRSAELIGRRENVLMAEHVFYFLKQNSESLATLAALNEKRRLLEQRGHAATTAFDKKSFRLGVLHGFSDKLRASHASNGESQPTSMIDRALVAYRKDPALRNYIGTIYPSLRSTSASSPRINGASFSAGQAAGRKLTLNKPITSSSGNLGRFLGSGRGR